MTRSNRVPRDVTGVIGADPISHIGAMGTESVEIAASDTKIRFSEMLRETERDKHFAIVRLGCPVARLIPAVDRGGLIKWSPTGVKLWECGLKAATKDSLPGQLRYPVADCRAGEEPAVCRCGGQDPATLRIVDDGRRNV